MHDCWGISKNNRSFQSVYQFHHFDLPWEKLWIRHMFTISIDVSLNDHGSHIFITFLLTDYRKLYYPVRKGGEISITESPRTNSMGILLFVVFNMCSMVSSSTSVPVNVSSTSPGTIFRCWSKACDKQVGNARAVLDRGCCKMVQTREFGHAEEMVRTHM